MEEKPEDERQPESEQMRLQMLILERLDKIIEALADLRKAQTRPRYW